MPSGILNLNKPPGWTSFDLVRFVRGRCGEKRVGHAGTLDPAATGVLPVLLGQATRLTEYLVDATKEYVATIELGVTTNTFDTEGEVLSRADASGISEDAVREALAAFRGEILQAPPAYSAVKREGVAAYKRARRGEEFRPEARPVRAEEIDITEMDSPKVKLRIVCGKGFYVRSLAHDLGTALGVGGTLSRLVRTRVGSFHLEEAIDIDTLRAELEDGSWTERLLAPDEVLLGWRAAILGPVNRGNLVHGREAHLEPVPGVAVAPGDFCRAYSDTGDFLAILRCQGDNVWRPEKVLAASTES